MNQFDSYMLNKVRRFKDVRMRYARNEMLITLDCYGIV